MTILAPLNQMSGGMFRRDLRKHGCVVLSGVIALIHAGMKRPKDLDAFAWDLFERSGETLAGFRKDGLSLDQLQRAIKATPSGDRVPWRTQRRKGVSVVKPHPKGTLRDQLKEHRDAVAVVNIDRGIIVKAGRATGYRGAHGIVIWYRSDEKAGVADSLIPGEVRLWEWSLLADAMDSFGDRPWGGGRGEALVVWPSPTWSSEVERYRDLMLRARGQRDTARARVAELEALADGTALARLQAVAKTVAGNLEEQVDILDKAVAA